MSRRRHGAGRATLPQVARSKYGVRTDAVGKLARTVDGILFASQREAKRYTELKLLERAGEIDSLQCQPRFQLWVYMERGTTIHAGMALERVRVGDYVADFRYWQRGSINSEVIEDVKGMRTGLYRWKKKHVEAQYGITIREI